MIVCAHGDVTKYCKSHDMIICENYNGDIEDYRGGCRVLVTDKDMAEYEYYMLKGKMLGKGVELISVRYDDDKLLTGFLAYQAEHRRKKYGGRQPFGFRKIKGIVVPDVEEIAVARCILELHDKGLSLRKIVGDARVHHKDGRRLSVSTAQQIVKNRSRYYGKLHKVNMRETFYGK